MWIMDFESKSIWIMDFLCGYNYYPNKIVEMSSKINEMSNKINEMSNKINEMSNKSILKISPYKCLYCIYK